MAQIQWQQKAWFFQWEMSHLVDRWERRLLLEGEIPSHDPLEGVLKLLVRRSVAEWVQGAEKTDCNFFFTKKGKVITFPWLYVHLSQVNRQGYSFL